MVASACGTCHGDGEVWKMGRGHRFVPCPTCRPDEHRADEASHADDFDPLYDFALVQTPA